MFAVMGNILLSLGIFSQGSTTGIIWDLLYFIVMTGIFTWVVSPPPESAKLPMSLRLLGGSCLGAVLLTVIFFRFISSADFTAYLDSMLNSFIAAQRSSNVVQLALLESVTAEAVLDMIIALTVRGGSLVSCLLLFTICRQLSLGLARMSLRRGRKDESKDGQTGGTVSSEAATLAMFRVIPSVIWVFSASLLLVVLTRMINLTVVEIILWNVLLLCVILYLAQGLGIIQFFLNRPSTPPFLGQFLIVLFIILLFSPVLNLVVLGGLTVLGIAENWVPFRQPKKKGPPSTPLAGDGE